MAVDLTDRERVLYSAIEYVLDRSQVDPDLGYLIGIGSESFVRLCAAEALALGELPTVVALRRDVDRQPAHRRREPDVVVLRARVEQLEDRVELLEDRLRAHGVEVPVTDEEG